MPKFACALQARNNLTELHELQEEKLLLSQMKSKTSIEKLQRRSFKRLSKHGENPPDDVAVKNKKELTALELEQQEKVGSRKVCPAAFV